MIPYVFIYCGLPENSFLRQGIGVRFLHKLRICKKSYLETWQSVPAFQDAEYILWNRQMPFTEEDVQDQLCQWQINSNVIFKKHDKICVLDMRFYPLDIKVIEHVLTKASSTDIPLYVFHESSENPILSVGSWNDIVNGSHRGDIAKIRFNDAQFLDLYVPINVLLLFNMNLSLRYFNSLSACRHGFFLKTSNNKEKMLAEHTFLNNLPSALRPYYPQCGDYIESKDTASYEIEVIPSLDIAKSVLNGLFQDERTCQTLVHKIQEYLNVSPQKKVSRDEFQALMHAVFIAKTQKRLEQIYELSQIEQFNSITHLQGWDSFSAFANAYIRALEEDIATHKEQTLTLSHGDLFFGNMLYDPVKQNLKLIDPRGGSTLGACWLPYWYDLAKLSHSFLGHYDFMVYELLTVVLAEDLTLQLQDPVGEFGFKNLEQPFRKMLSDSKIDEKQLRLYEGSLFLSMIPLHKESPLRMTMQLLRAMELYKFFKD